MSMRESPITPSIGRIVLVRGGDISLFLTEAELPAIITQVHDQNTIDLWVAGECRNPFFKRVRFDPNMVGTPVVPVWRWMDYQVQAAAKSREEIEIHHAVEVSTPADRVKAERVELEGRWNKLSHFLCSSGHKSLSQAHRELLLEQQDVMARYSQILEKRIRLFETEA